MNLPGAGEETSRMAFDRAVTLMTEDGTEVRIEGPFDLTVDEATIEDVDPSLAAPHAAVLVGQLGRRVAAVRVPGGGALEIRIEGGSALLVHPGREYETWIYDGSDGSKVVGMPDGDVASWGVP